MEVLKILDKPDTIDWEYDEEADVLYLSVGTPKPAVGVDIGEGVVVRCPKNSLRLLEIPHAVQWHLYSNAECGQIVCFLPRDTKKPSENSNFHLIRLSSKWIMAT